MGETNNIAEKLFSDGASSLYEDTTIFQNHIVEQYKVYLESAENISARRQTANSFFVTINTALIALISYIHLGQSNTTKYYWLVALAGIAISFMWYRLIRSYRDLNSAKFKVIHQIEKKLPLSPFDAEWEAVGRGNDASLYLPFTHIEVGIPWVFIILHFVAFTQSFPWEVLKAASNAS
jgi:hypothetical protein